MHVRKLALPFLLAVLASFSLVAQNPQPANDVSSSRNAGPVLTDNQIKELVRRVAENDIANDQKASKYTYVQHVVERKLDGNGNVRSTETKTSELMQLYGEQVSRLIAKNDKPLSEKEAAKEEEKIQKLIKKRSEESDGDRKKRLEKEAKEREEARQFVREICDAYNMRLSGVETIQGRETLIIDGDPRPGYQPKMKDAKYLNKFKLRAWIDPTTDNWVKLSAEAIDNISWGAFLVKINKGMRFNIQQTRVNDEIWLPERIEVKLGGRALFKSLNVEIDVSYRDYKKFRTDVKISEPTEVSDNR